MDLKDIKLIIDLMKRNDLSVFQMEKDGFKLLLKKNLGAPGGYAMSNAPVTAAAPTMLPVAPATQPALAETTPSVSAAPVEKFREITSPMVGTFYAAMSPDAPPYAKVGQSVTEESVVCIIEAMKVMNEIKPEISGTIVEVVAQNGKPVQFGQVLFRVK